MNMKLILGLGIGYLILRSRQAAPATVPALPASSPANSGNNTMVSVTPVSGSSPTSVSNAIVQAALAPGATNVSDNGSADGQSLLNDYYSSVALPGEAAPLTVGPSSANQANVNATYVAANQQLNSAIASATAAENSAANNDVTPVSQAELEAYQAGKGKKEILRIRKEQAIGARSRKLAMDADQESARMTSARNKQYAKQLATSLAPTTDASLAAAYDQPYGDHQGGVFSQHPGMGFVEGTPVNLSESDFSAHSIVDVPPFENHQSSRSLGMRDYARYSDQKEPVSDFSGVLVNEAGSADFSEFITNDVKNDFGSVPRRMPVRPAQRRR